MEEILKKLENEIRQLRMISIPVDLTEQVTLPVYSVALNLEKIMNQLKEEPKEVEEDGVEH